MYNKCSASNVHQTSLYENKPDTNIARIVQSALVKPSTQYDAPACKISYEEQVYKKSEPSISGIN